MPRTGSVQDDRRQIRRLGDSDWGTLGIRARVPGVARRSFQPRRGEGDVSLLSLNVTELRPPHGFAANLSTALLVLLASRAGVPVSDLKWRWTSWLSELNPAYPA